MRKKKRRGMVRGRRNRKLCRTGRTREWSKTERGEQEEQGWLSRGKQEE